MSGIVSARLILAYQTFAVFVIAAVVVVAACGCESRATMMYRRAEEFFAQGQYQLAADEYKRLVDTYPRSEVADAALYKFAYLYAVHLGNVKTAIAAYERLSREYPESPYASLALLATVHLAATRLRSPSLAVQAVKRLEKAYPERRELITRAYLELARAYLRAGQPQQALKYAEKIWNASDVQAEQVAAAGLVLAEVFANSQDEQGKAAAILEEVATKYPDTIAAEEARKRLGLLYYAKQKQEAQRRQEELKRQSRWLAGLSKFSAHSWSPLDMLEGLRILLEFQGVDVDLPTLAAMSKTALVPVVPPGQSIPVLWKADPLSELMEACGISASVWNAATKDEAWEAARGAISHGRPVLIVYSARYPWCVIGGWNAQRQEVGLLLPGKSQLQAVKLQDFMAQWKPADAVISYIAFPANHYYVASASGQIESVDIEVLRSRAFAGLVEFCKESPLAERPTQIAREAAGALRKAAQDGRCPDAIFSWARRNLPQWAEARRVMGEFLEPFAPDIAAQARHIADVLGALRSAILSARDSDAPGRDLEAAASYADRLATEEENFLHAIRALRSGEGS